MHIEVWHGLIVSDSEEFTLHYNPRYTQIRGRKVLSFVWGKSKESDKDIENTAKREMREELGLHACFFHDKIFSFVDREVSIIDDTSFVSSLYVCNAWEGVLSVLREKEDIWVWNMHDFEAYNWEILIEKAKMQERIQKALSVLG